MRCQQCTFFVPYPQSSHGAGECHRYPPSYPHVDARFDWCGEWQKKTIANVESQDDH